MTIGADDVRRLLASQDADTALVVIQGHAAVVAPADLNSAEYRGALQVATRQELVQRVGHAELSDRELAEQAEELDTALRNLGG
ncbi:hypothetical protein [Mycobacterium sp. 852002-40037_SCH5390672]|uniref:hypothetical protein n=1 Tax=Mycobacterium sp. 852002-40037_SCH5390672 TaxID=1834089 RepID=UPI000804D5BF|nr:hypothetical protein [Mycobacterium sp. 852002-40037_SCH5390672]OBB96428.1 hypothetical protein A5782_04585 [Mycobacterium sp. 852002-40037_SCH5390672]